MMLLEGLIELGILAVVILGAYAWARYIPMNEDKNGKWTR